MADFIGDTMTYLTQGSIGGIPPIAIIFMAVLFFVVVYMLMSKKPRRKEFKPLNMRKETKKRLNKEYRFFGVKLGQPIFDVAGMAKDGELRYEKKAFGHVVGYMKAVWFDQYKRYEPIHPKTTKQQLMEYVFAASKDVYNKTYAELDDVQKKNIMELAKEEARYNAVEDNKRGAKMVNGKLEVTVNEPIPCYILRICPNSILYRLLSSLTTIGTNYFLFKEDQVRFEDERMVLTGTLPREEFNGQFVFSNAAKGLIENIGFAYEREENLSATANAIPRVLAHDFGTGASLLMKREEYDQEGKKWARVKEGQE